MASYDGILDSAIEDATAPRPSQHYLARSRAASLDGGNPNCRVYSRLNWLGLSYPTPKATELASPSPATRSDRAPRYYAAQVRDPDGYGLEFVYKDWQHET